MLPRDSLIKISLTFLTCSKFSVILKFNNSGNLIKACISLLNGKIATFLFFIKLILIINNLNIEIVIDEYVLEIINDDV